MALYFASLFLNGNRLIFCRVNFHALSDALVSSRAILIYLLLISMLVLFLVQSQYVESLWIVQEDSVKVK